MMVVHGGCIIIVLLWSKSVLSILCCLQVANDQCILSNTFLGEGLLRIYLA